MNTDLIMIASSWTDSYETPFLSLKILYFKLTLNDTPIATQAYFVLFA